jgi:hypothetical protein
MDSIQVKGSFLMMKDEFVSGNLYQFELRKIIKSFKIINGDFSFRLPSSIAPGVYRLQYEGGVNSPHTDIIVDGKEPVVSFGIRHMGDNFYPDFMVSVANKKWYDYVEDSNSRVARLNRLWDYLSHFSDQATGKQITAIYQKERRNYYKLFRQFVKENEATWQGLVVANTPYYFSDLNKNPVERDFIRMDYYWEGIDTSNSKLINTPVYSEHIQNYLKGILKKSEKATVAFKEYQLKKAIDVVIEQFSKTSSTRSYAIDCLKEYFNKSDGLEMYGALNYSIQKEKLGYK